MEILITFEETVAADPQKESIEKIIHTVLTEAAQIYGLNEADELSVLLCDDAYIHELNRTYRHIDRPTDVLSFALNEDDSLDEAVPMEIGENPERNLLGDLIISLDRMRAQAKEYGHSEERELAYLTIHGCLHILGYDHMTDEDKSEMREEEEFVLQRLGYLREGQSYNE